MKKLSTSLFLIPFLALNLPAFAKMKIGAPMKSGKVYAFVASANGITWQRCKEFTVLDETTPCAAEASVTLPETFFKALFLQSLKSGKIKAQGSLTEEDVTAARALLKSSKTVSAGEMAESIKAQSAAIAAKADYFKKYDLNSSEAKQVVALYDSLQTQLEVIDKIDSVFNELVTQIKSSKWAVTYEGKKTLGGTLLKIASNLFDDQQLNAQSFALKSAPAESPTLATYYAKLEGIKFKSQPTLMLQYSGGCYLDENRTTKIQCWYGNTMVPSAVTGLPEDLTDGKLFYGYSGRFMVFQKDQQYYPIYYTGNNYSSNYSYLTTAISSKNLTVLDTGPRTAGITTIDPQGNFYTELGYNTIGNSAASTPDGVPEMIVEPYYVNGESNSTFTGCWIAGGKVLCANSIPYYAPLFPAKGEANAVLQLSGVKYLSASYYNGGNLTTAICSASDSKVACTLHNGKTFTTDVDASRGMQAFSSTNNIEAIVCALGVKKMRCFDALNNKEVNFKGLTDASEVFAMAKESSYLCGVTDKGVVCTPNSGMNVIKLEE